MLVAQFCFINKQVAWDKYIVQSHPASICTSVFLGAAVAGIVRDNKEHVFKERRKLQPEEAFKSKDMCTEQE